MKLILNQDEFEHLPDISVYNNNYYKHKKLGYVIFEKCDEEYNEQEFYLIEKEDKVFIGCSKDGFGLSSHNDTIEIDFKVMYT